MTGRGSRKTPLYAGIAAALRDEIGAGRFAVGSRLPTEADLAARFGVNRHTVRHAIAELVDEGLVRTRRGSGAYLTARPLDYPLGRRVRFHKNLEAAGRLPEKRVLAVTVEPADTDSARRLKVAEGAAIAVYHAVSFADGRPIALVESRFPECRLPGLAGTLKGAKGVTPALAAVGVTDYARASTRVSARPATALQALHLQMREGDPVLLSTAINVDAEGVPVEYGQTWFAGDRVTLTLEAEGSPRGT